MIRNLTILILCLLIVGCSAVRIKYISDEYKQLDSPCFDGLLLNLEEAKCRDIKAFKIPHTGVVKLECVSRGSDSHWLNNLYYIIPMTELYYFEDQVIEGNLYPFPVCVDNILIVGAKRIK